MKITEYIKGIEAERVDQYCIAKGNFYVVGQSLCQAINNMPGFEPFCTAHGVTVATTVESPTVISEKDVPDFYICLSDKPNVATRHSQYTFQSDGVDSEFFGIDTGYLLEMRHEDGSHLDLWSDTSHRIIYIYGDLLPQMLRFALWTGYGVMTATYHRIAVHGSCIINEDKAYLFLGESGTGKSTHTRLWREYIAGSFLLNDDSPIIASEEDGIYIYGSPWSGKTPCYKPLRYPLGGCVRLTQAPYNKIQQLTPLKAYAALHPSCPPEFAYDEELYNGISQTLDNLLRCVPIYHLACLPDRAAAQLSHDTITKP